MGTKKKYGQKEKDAICERLMDGESLRSICRDKNMPSTIWVLKELDKDPDFVIQYARARELQQEHYGEEILEIADNCTDDVMTITLNDSYEKDVINHSAISRAKVQIDARKWLMSKLAPKVYGNNSSVDLTSKGKQMRGCDPGNREILEAMGIEVVDEVES